MESQGPIESPALPDEIDVPPGMDLSVFTNLVYVRKPGEMVHIDFAQIDTGAAYPPGRGSFVARVVMHPALAAVLVGELSKRLAPTEDSD
jgi:hypothetical protein